MVFDDAMMPDAITWAERDIDPRCARNGPMTLPTMMKRSRHLDVRPEDRARACTYEMSR